MGNRHPRHARNATTPQRVTPTPDTASAGTDTGQSGVSLPEHDQDSRRFRLASLGRVIERLTYLNAVVETDAESGTWVLLVSNAYSVPVPEIVHCDLIRGRWAFYWRRTGELIADADNLTAATKAVADAMGVSVRP